MEHREYESLARREEFNFWHVARRELLARLLRRHLPPKQEHQILDIGCGTGGDILLLKPFGRVFGLDSFDEALRLAAGKGFAELRRGSAERMPFPDASFDAAVALDVLEHLDDDVRSIREAYRVLRVGGIFLVTVPAYPWLWSQHDVVLYHKRRYFRSEVCRKLSEGGFVICASSYFVMLGALVNGFRKLRDSLFIRAGKPHVYNVVFSSPVNALLLFILRLEQQLMRLFPLPFGLSIVVVAKKSSLSYVSR